MVEKKYLSTPCSSPDFDGNYRFGKKKNQSRIRNSTGGKED
jgi:hypothetical protein